ncbi:hypothetical protein KKC60_05830 [Patescibacteria group bacterium]|nr:hypothetical protein [Patescibacteria group bacterium]
MKKNEHEKPLTLSDLVSYNEKVLFPMLETKFEKISEEYATKKEMREFENRVLERLDDIVTMIKPVNQEVTVMRYQRDHKDKKLWKIMVDAMENGKILSDKELNKISKLGIF